MSDQPAVKKPGKVQITSDGTGRTTKVMCDGVELSGVRSVVIDPITHDGIVVAKIEFICPEIDITFEEKKGA